MPTAESVKAKIQNLINLANDITGNNDSDLTSAVTTLSEGYSQGGGSSAGSGQHIIDAILDRSITEITSNAVTLGSSAFHNCSKLVEASLPLLKTMENGAFNGCKQLVTVDCPLLTNVSDSAFFNCSSLKNVSWPLVKTVGTSAFNGCSALITADLPLATSVKGQSFSKCYKLESVNIPLADQILSNTFNDCFLLKSIDLHVANTINSYAFEKCYSLIAVVLRSTTRCSLANTNAFKSCLHLHGTAYANYNPESLKDCYIYVPAALIEDYKVATNWSEFATQFRALEDYTVDGTTTGALDESKI